MTQEQAFNINELLTVVLARDLRDGEVGYTGLATGAATALFATSIPLAGMDLARRSHAPNLTSMFAGWAHNVDLSTLDALPEAEFDDFMRDLPSEGQLREYPGQISIRRGDVDFGFSSGVQTDQVGNLNTAFIGDPNKPKVRLVGSILVPEHFSMFRREYVMMARHDRRSFVEKVDYISGVGYPGGEVGRKALGLRWGGPELVMTTKCIFDFDKVAGRMKVRSIHPGVSVDEVKDLTGFDLGDLTNVPRTVPPTDAELDLLRHHVDPKGILTRSYVPQD